MKRLYEDAPEEFGSGVDRGVCLLSVLAYGQDVVVNEFMAVNNHTLTNLLGESPDWIELYNTTGGDIDLGGWYLTDTSNNLVKAPLPATNLSAYGYMIIRATGTNAVIDGNIHVDFQLGSGGEYLGLVRPDGVTIEHEYAPEYPGQQSDVSYGILADRINVGYFDVPTPGSENSLAGFNGIAEEPVFSLPGGFYTNSQALSITVTSGAAVVRYTVNTGSEPTESSPAFGAPIAIQSRVGQANVYSQIQTAPMGAQAQWSWMPKWSPPAGEVFKVTVVRARVYEPGKLPGRIVTKTYFVGTDILTRYPTMPIVSLVSDSNHFFHPATGQYVPGDSYNGSTWSGNYYFGWTKPTHMEWYDTNRLLRLDQEVGTRIQGSTSPASPQKGLHVIADSEFSDRKSIKYRIFARSHGRAADVNEFKRFMLRGWGSFRGYAFIYDTFAQWLIADEEDVCRDVDMQDYQPCIVFLNGEYWGLHEAREMNKTSWYYQEYMGIDRNDPGYDVLNGRGPYTNGSPTFYSEILEGDSFHWDRMIEYMTSHDLRVPTNYEYVQTQMDTKNFIESVVVSAFTMRQDWPDQNETKYRPRTPDGRWRWPVYDCDHSFYESYTLDMINQMLYGGRQYPTLQRLIVNAAFSNEFVNCYADYMNTYFRQDVMLGKFKTFVDELIPYMPEMKNRWPIEKGGTWEAYITLMRGNVSNRTAWVRNNIITKFGPTQFYPLTIDVSATNQGTIVLNERIQIDADVPGVEPGMYPWSGYYFDNTPVRLRAVPERGYEFAGWQGDVVSSSNPVTFYMTNSMSITASFISADPVPVVLSEIMYNPAAATNGYNNDDFEFIELHNRGLSQVDLSGFTFTKGIVFTFADGTTLDPGEYVLVVKNLDAFASRYDTNGMNIAGEYRNLEVAHGSLDNGGDRVMLKMTRWGPTVFTFAYSDGRGWPLAADGAGHSLVPLDFENQDLDSLYYGGHWRASTFMDGSPGRADPDPVAGVVLNEIIAHTDTNAPPYDSNDRIELYNVASSNITLTSDWYLSDDTADLKKWAFSETVISNNSFLDLDEMNDFHNPITTGFGLNKAGEQVFLSFLPGSDEDRVVDCVRFKGQENNTSLGRYPDGNTYWYALAPSSGMTNNAPEEHAVINEIMYHPAPRNGETEENTDDEYVELYNPTGSQADLWNASGTWRIDGGIEYSFPILTSIPVDGYLVLVSFDPADPVAMDAFIDSYGPTDGVSRVLGPYANRLSNRGERIALERPQAPDWPGDPISWVIVDEVIYFDQMPWPSEADGTGRPLVRINNNVSGNDPSNWQIGGIVRLLRLHWRFNQSSGTTAIDSSGHGRTGALLDLDAGNGDGDSPPAWTTGKYSSALTFDGNDDVVRYSGAVVSSYPFTLMAWVRTSDNVNSPCAVALNTSSDAAKYFTIGAAAGKAEIVVSPTARNRYAAVGTTTVSDNEWHHLAGVFINNTNRILYVDGIPEATLANDVAFFPEIDRCSAGLCDRNAPWDNQWPGQIDDVRVYNEALSQSDILAFMAGDGDTQQPDPNEDLDGDGLPDNWEIFYFNATNAPEGEHDGHADTDAASNWEEYIAGTDPTNAASCLVLDICLSNDSVAVSFPTLTAAGQGYYGLSRSYNLEYLTELFGSWQPVDGATNIPGDNSVITHTNSLNAAEFYRAKTTLQ